jgi:thiol-disulfide isomerase/thioredoxin
MMMKLYSTKYSARIEHMSATKIIVYSATWCAFCHAAKEYFDKLGIAYEDRDI